MSIEQAKNKYLYLIVGIRARKVLPEDYKLLPNNYIQIYNFEPNPMEDYEYIFSDTDISEDEAWYKWVDHV